MTHCADHEERLNDYLDRLLAEPERAGVERHLEGCAGCREYFAALRSLRERTDALPRSLEPAGDLWPEIRESLAGRKRGVPRPIPGFPAWMTGWGGLVPAAASVALVFLIALAVVIGLRRGTLQPVPGEPGVSDPGPAVSAGVATAALPPRESLELVETEYRAATEKLLAALQREGGGASPQAVKVIEDNLRIVEEAIQEIHRVAGEGPGSAAEDHRIAGLYRTRFELLLQAVRLSSRKGEEKQS